MKKILELLVCILHPLAVVLIWIDLFTRRDISAIRFVLTDAKFREACSRAVNPFGDGKSAERIVGILRDIRIDQALLDKQTTY